jgi:hypothetical protein
VRTWDEIHQKESAYAHVLRGIPNLGAWLVCADATRMRSLSAGTALYARPRSEISCSTHRTYGQNVWGDGNDRRERQIEQQVRDGPNGGRQSQQCVSRRFSGLLRNYMFPVNRRMTLITVSVELEIRCDTKPRSIPNCEPRRGRTIKSPIRIIIP